MALPDFLVIGAPKSGTTALHVALSRHPQLWMSQVKEPKYFLCDGKPLAHRGPGDARTSRQAVWDRSQYEALLDASPAGALRGESTSLYLADTAAHARIAKVLPENVTAHAGDSRLDRAAAQALRVATAVEHRLPERWWKAIDRSLSGHLQREQRRRSPLRPDEREELIPRVTDDVRLLEELTGESFSDWLDPHRPDPRANLTSNGRIGTAHSSIDRPLGDNPA